MLIRTSLPIATSLYLSTIHTRPIGLYLHLPGGRGRPRPPDQRDRPIFGAQGPAVTTSTPPQPHPLNACRLLPPTHPSPHHTDQLVSHRPFPSPLPYHPPDLNQAMLDKKHLAVKGGFKQILTLPNGTVRLTLTLSLTRRHGPTFELLRTFRTP